MEFINASETREDDEEFKNAVDELFEELEAENPEHFAVRQYRKYKLAAGKTAKSILISCGARLAPFDIQELREIMSYDEMELDMIGDQNETCTLKCMPVVAQEETKEEFLLKKLEEYDFEEKRRRS